jgi:sec-independent protein translocase protein TatA
MGIESPVHLLFIAAVALIVLGPKRLPQLARAVGQGIREFRGAIESAQSEPPEELPLGEETPAAAAAPVADDAAGAPAGSLDTANAGEASGAPSVLAPEASSGTGVPAPSAAGDSPGPGPGQAPGEAPRG